MMATVLAFLAAALLGIAAVIELALGRLPLGVVEAAGSVAYYALGLTLVLRGRR